VLLPPAKASLEDLLAQGMVAAVRARGLPLDIVLADVGYQQVLAGTVADSLHQAVLQPALRKATVPSGWPEFLWVPSMPCTMPRCMLSTWLASSCWLPIPVRPTSCRKSALLAGRRPGRMLRPACRTNAAGGTGWLQEQHALPGVAESGRRRPFRCRTGHAGQPVAAAQVHRMAGDHSWPVWQQQWQHWLDHGPLAQGAPPPKDKT
jgi:hypothetical protein